MFFSPLLDLRVNDGTGIDTTLIRLPYRMNQQSDNVNDRPVKHLPGNATIGFLEFDDQGEPWRTPNLDDGWSSGSSTQLPHVLNELKKQSAKGPIRTLVFIHGWNNNAAPGNPNLVLHKS